MNKKELKEWINSLSEEEYNEWLESRGCEDLVYGFTGSDEE